MNLLDESLDTKAYLDMLLTGFLSSDTDIQEACEDTLLFWGEHWGHDLICALEGFAMESKSPSIKCRIEQLMDQIDPDYPGTKTVHDMIRMCLDANGPLLRRKAVLACRGLRWLCHDLVRSAIGQRPADCARYLQAAVATGGVPAFHDREAMVKLHRSTKHEAIKAATAVLIERLRSSETCVENDKVTDLADSIDGCATPGELKLAWQLLIKNAQTLLAHYPDCIVQMPDDSPALGRVQRLAEAIREAIECDPLAT